MAFGSLLLLIGLAGFGVLRKGLEISRQLNELYKQHRSTERALVGIRGNMYEAEALVRDYLLDPSHITGELHRKQLLAIRAQMTQQLQQVAGRLKDTDNEALLRRLQAELESYWDALDPLFEWTPTQKAALSSFFLRRTVLPRRNAVLQIAREIREIDEANQRQQREDLERRQAEFSEGLIRILLAALVLGFIVALVAVLRISRLEGHAEEARLRTVRAEEELRQLSQQLVHGQEAERKALSRELHDEVGQMLTALRVELGTLERLRTSADSEFRKRLQEAKSMTEQTLRAIRDLAMGLRPSMLDDLGLQPALEWQAREFSRRHGVPVELQIEGPLQDLPETHRTCVYRVIQEALTNCARHAHANVIRVRVHGHEDTLLLTIQDDGVGMNVNVQRTGLGLLGIDERVRELGGTLHIYSQTGKGTVLSAEIPVRGKEAA